MALRPRWRAMRCAVGRRSGGESACGEEGSDGEREHVDCSICDWWICWYEGT